MKNVLLIVTVLFFSAFTNAQNNFQNRTIKILLNSKLTITGDTNIKSFDCVFDMGYLQKENHIKFITDDPGHIRFKNAILSLNTKGFDCGSAPINRDFHKLIQSDKHPQILIELLEVRLQKAGSANAVVNITIAGTRKEHTFPVEFTAGAVSNIKGILMLDIKDFKLEPPKKLFGMIVVKDEIEIDFDLSIQK
ncbi:YceI family protein [Salegentibacter sp. F188]|uniref:YceI family protein n=1 Tax=Autumnicola patrickiae TaxID=3075591 RepID=A0ABU3DZX6_9FLAO|nr:YceI family protein [Salegentibacter sp. F188]MDT0689268.1 YceI family protein [Salegentibacter sp. F188]